MKHLFFLSILCLFVAADAAAQSITPDGNNGYNEMDEFGNVTTQRQKKNTADSLGTDKEIPKGIRVWTVDSRFGDRKTAQVDTLSHMFQNTIFTEGLRGEYNTTGNLGAPRIARLFIDRPLSQKFIFTTPYDFFVTPVNQFLFTNTLSPITNLSYYSAGDKVNGEDAFKALFGVNAGKKLGVGFKFDYLYGRGYYSNQSTSHFNYTMYGSYIDDRYEAHILLSTNHQKVAENGGITDDNYIRHPEIFNENYETNEIPTALSRNWNRNDNNHLFFTHRYNVGFHRRVPMTQEEIAARKFAIAAQKDAEKRKQAINNGSNISDQSNQKDKTTQPQPQGRPEGAPVTETPIDAIPGKDNGRIAVNSKQASDSLMAIAKKTAEDSMWMKTEYVPVTSFIHTLSLDSYRRIYQAYETPTDYYLNDYNVVEKLSGDSIYDKTQYFRIKNILAISLLEGFNKWAKAGLKVFASHELRHYTLPGLAGTAKWNENAITIGGQLYKQQGKTLHYNATGEFAVVGDDAGEIHIDGTADINIPLFRDTLSLVASGFWHHERPSFYYRHYQSRHLWWDNNFGMTDHLRISGQLNYNKTGTSIRVAFDEIKNYTYFTTAYQITDGLRTANTVAAQQSSTPITLITLQLAQNFKFGPLHWENVLTYQKSTQADIIPVPDLNIYSNLFLRFKIAKVLKCDFGADVRYFTSYNAPEYVPMIGNYANQGNETPIKVGNYPIANVYANFHLKHTRFFVMYSHANEGMGNSNYFLTPHYPINQRILRFGLSWNFWN